MALLVWRVSAVISTYRFQTVKANLMEHYFWAWFCTVCWRLGEATISNFAKHKKWVIGYFFFPLKLLDWRDFTNKSLDIFIFIYYSCHGLL